MQEVEEISLRKLCLFILGKMLSIPQRTTTYLPLTRKEYMADTGCKGTGVDGVF
jgi:hypothetical protein